VETVLLGGALLLCGVAALPARAQTITNLGISKNGGNSNDQLKTGNDAYQNKTTVAIQSSTATGFTAR